MFEFSAVICHLSVACLADANRTFLVLNTSYSLFISVCKSSCFLFY
jgi:hypothetical protein